MSPYPDGMQVHRWLAQCKDHDRYSIPQEAPLPKAITEIPAQIGMEAKLRLPSNEMGSYLVLSYCPGEVNLPKYEVEQEIHNKVPYMITVM
jgi:hypothetical protein